MHVYRTEPENGPYSGDGDGMSSLVALVNLGFALQAEGKLPERPIAYHNKGKQRG